MTAARKERTLSNQYRRWPLLAAFGLAVAAMIASAVVMLASMRADALRRAGAQLQAVGALKTAALRTWIDDRVVDAHYACSYPSIVRAAAAARSGRTDRTLKAHVDEILSHFADRLSYPLVGLLDAIGRPLALAGRDAADARLPDRWFLERALANPEGGATRLDITPDGDASLDVVVAEKAGEGAVAFCLLRADARAFVEELIERWPVPSDSGSAALFRVEADAAVLYVPRRERPPEKVVRVPLADRERAAVRAVRGEEGLIEGQDWAGTQILIRSRPVLGTDWFLRTRLNVDEVMAPLRRPRRAIAGLIIAFAVAGVAFLLRWWRDDGRRAAAEGAARQSRERLELAVAGTHAVWDWDLEDGRLQVEGELARVLGIPEEGLRGDVATVIAALVHSDDRPALNAVIEAHLRDETPFFESEQRAERAGAPLWVRLRGQVVGWDDAGRPARMAGVASDVTERRRLQAQLDLSQRMAGLGRLAAGVAHEINNPLSSVIANLTFVEEGLPGASREIRQALLEARDAAVRVGDVVRGLKAFSSPGKERRGPVDVGRELEAALKLAHHELRHRAETEIRIGDLPRVVADTHELGQVFLNLLVNAAQAVPEGRAEEHRIGVHARTNEEGWAEVEIRDDGIGIPPDVLGRIFEPFFTTKPLGVGTGLGLAIAHGIVAAAGGRIEVESRVGHGSTFRVLLPPASGEEAAPTATPPSRPEPPPAAPQGTKVRVLVIDDEPLVAGAVVRALGSDYEVATSGSARDALARFEAGERFDAVLCDLMMPQMTGMELYARVSALWPDAAAGFVFVTGGAFTEAAADFLRTTPNRWIEKPFEPVVLRETVDRVARAPGVHM